MSGRLREIKVVATIEDTQEWSADLFRSYYDDTPPETLPDDWVIDGLRAHLQAAAIEYHDAHPTLFRAEPSVI